MPDATKTADGRDYNRLTLGAAALAYELRQLADGRAGVKEGSQGAASGATAFYSSAGKYTMPKTASVVFLDGGRAYWDHSANAVNYKKVNDRDFYIGRFVGDAASVDTECTVNINAVGEFDYDIDALRDPCLTALIGTPAFGGFDYPRPYGGAVGLTLTATSEVQKVDLFSVDRFSKNGNAIIEMVVRFGNGMSGSDVDFNIGIANGTVSDADNITESVFFHFDGGSLNILAESDDGTTEVAATDTTIDFAGGSDTANRYEFWIDTRNPADIQLYVDGVNVLPATTFTINAATGPFGLLAHLRKATGTQTAGPIYIDRLCARFAEQ